MECGVDYSVSCRRRPYFATTQLPRNANTVTKTAVGMVELLPSLLVNRASGPQIALKTTATHMAVIAMEAHISQMRRWSIHLRPSIAVGGCDMVDISTPPFEANSDVGRLGSHQGWPGSLSPRCPEQTS